MSLPPPVQEDACFISYSRSDQQFALRFANDLRSAGIVTWVDQLDIRPSEHWDRAVERAIASCRCVVVLLSPRSVASENVADEISLSIDMRKAILPVMIEPCKLPLRLTRMHLIDATAGYGSALKQCLAEIRSNFGQSPPPERDPKGLASVKDHLANIVGPIAGILVDRAAARAASVEDLYSLLARHIHHEADREKFVSLMPRVSNVPEDAESTEMMDSATYARSMTPFELERIATALTKFLGPIATIIVREESKAYRTVQQLGCRLAELLSSEDDRVLLLKEIETDCQASC
jgi:hypothetical protein